MTGNLIEQGKIEQLLTEFYSMRTALKSYIFSIIRDYHAAEDVLQNVALAIVQQASRFEEGRSSQAWFMGIARNQSFLWIRKQNKTPISISVDTLDECFAGEANLGMEKLLRHEEALLVCIKNLPKKQENIIALRYGKGLSCGIIAKESNKSIQYVYSVIKRVKTALRKCVEQRLEEELA